MNKKGAVPFCVILVGVLLFGGSFLAFADDDELALAEAAQNPIADMISVPFQNNFVFGMGPDDDFGNILNVQPVIPIEATENWNLITRTIMPVIYSPEITPGTGAAIGLGDINETLFLSPSKPSKVIWGAGPTFTFPSATATKLGSEKWSVGPAVVALSITGKWVYGALVNNQWSYAGNDDRQDYNVMLMQPFCNYNLPKGWYLTSSPIITANWESNSNNRWTIPIGGGVGKILNIKKQPFNIQLQGYYNIAKPSTGGKWTIRLQVQLLFPRKGKT
jgi:hypothetical protein